MNHQLKLISAHGDETFAALSYVVCPLADAAEVAAIVERGLTARVGGVAVSTNLVMAKNSSSHMIVLRRPAQPFLGYAVSTTAVIDRQAKTVSGNPTAYAAGRNELAWYTESDVEAARQRSETNDVAYEGISVIIPAGYVAATIENTSALKAVLDDLAVASITLAPFDLNYLESAITEALSITPSFTQGSETQVAHGLTVGTAEALVMSRLRQLRWEGLALLGYHFTDEGQPATIKTPADIDAHRQQLDRLEAQLKGQSLLVAELTWLKPHVTTAIAMMRTELNDGLPESAK